MNLMVFPNKAHMLSTHFSVACFLCVLVFNIEINKQNDKKYSNIWQTHSISFNAQDKLLLVRDLSQKLHIWTLNEIKISTRKTDQQKHKQILFGICYFWVKEMKWVKWTKFGRFFEYELRIMNLHMIWLLFPLYFIFMLA